MRLILKAINFEFDGPTTLYRDDLCFNDLGNDKNLFTKDYLVERIVNAQEDGTLKRRWIDEEQFYEFKKSGNMSSQLINMNSLEFSISCVNRYCACDVNCCVDAIVIYVRPDTPSEYNEYIKSYLKHCYRKVAINGVLALPRLNHLSDEYNATEVGEYVTIHAFDKYDTESTVFRRDESYFYVIRKSDISKTTIGIYAPEDLIPHLIGKGGTRIAKAKKILKEYCGEDKRINLAKAK